MPISLRDDVPLRWPSREDYSARWPLPSKQRVAGSNPAGRAGQSLVEVSAGAAGSQKGASRSKVAPLTQASLSKRRGQGEDSIYWDASKNRFVGAVSLGFTPSGTRIRKKVVGRTKTEVRDKLKELHKQVESGLRPRRRYTVGDALDDWLAVGVNGLSARTVTLYRDTIAKALREELGTVRLTDLTAGNVQGALTALAARSSSRTVQIAHNVLVRAIRQAERDDLGRPQCCGTTRPRRPSWSTGIRSCLV
jgi:hypothetical protein